MNSRAIAAAVALALQSGAMAAAAPALQAQQTPRVAVLEFDNPTDWFGRQLGASAASQLITRLVNSGEFTVLERQRIEDVDAEAYRGATGRITPEQAVELGQQLGAQYLITGEFEHFDINTLTLGRGPLRAYQAEAESRINVRVINAATGGIDISSEADGKAVVARGVRSDDVVIERAGTLNPTLASRALAPALDRIVADLVEKRAMFGSGGGAGSGALAGENGGPAITGFADDGSAYLDQGENAGIQVGNRFNVVRVVDEIRDSNGNVLDEITERVGVVEVVRVLARSSIAAVKEGRPDLNDRLEPASGS